MTELTDKLYPTLPAVRETPNASSVYLGLLAQPFYPIFPHFSKLGPLFKTS